ncbi:MAG TPA: aspartate ammonia-lyase [Oscillatoriaceae cyanobacterium]
MANDFRIESDSLGERELPAEAYYGIQTQRARENFPISGLTLPEAMIRAIAAVKIAAARVNCQLGELDEQRAEAIIRAASEVRDGLFNDSFVVDAFQAGAGTSFHMNANEVIANRANELLGAKKGDYSRVHPNDHVNMGQSTNDVFPTAMRLAALDLLPDLLAAFDELAAALDEKAKAFENVIKSGRTHLQDAVPITLGQEFGGYAQAVFQARRRIARTEEALLELGIGGSAAGTGLNTLPEYRERVVQQLAQLTGLPLLSSGNLFEAMQSLAPFADTSAALRNAALELSRIANDFRLLASGPRTGFDELKLPAVQPGSSIMPGKINPSMAEMLNQVCFQVLGKDATIAFATQAGQLELNVMMPVVAFNLLGGMLLLTNALVAFTLRCVRGVEANVEAAHTHAMRSLGLATALNPLIGYRAAAEVVKQAVREGRAIPDVVVERRLMNPEEARRAFSPETLTRPGRLEAKPGEFAASEPTGYEWVRDPELLKECDTQPGEWDLPP